MATRYEIIRSIARGGMAEVFRARTEGTEGLGKVVALKRILPTFMADTEAVKMLKDEARIALRLNHPNIVQVFEFDRDSEGYFLAMEFVDGPNLAQLLNERRDRDSLLPEACSVAIAIALLRALHYAHRLADDQRQPLHVVHRDVSPGNIMLTTDGMVKLGDFGIAKARGRLQTTVAGTVKGKIPYMSPEQVAGEEVDGRSDQFAASLVLWECLTNIRCYEDPDDAALIRKVMLGKVRTFEEVDVKVPSALADIVRRGLHVDRDRRYPTAGSMAQALEKYHRTAHPDFGPEYLAALLNSTLPATQLVPMPEDPEERDRATRVTGGPPKRPTSGETAPRRRPAGHREHPTWDEPRRADDVIAELEETRPPVPAGIPPGDEEEEETTALERRPKNLQRKRR